MTDDLSRTELRRIADEFKSERDAAKRDTMRAFDERNIAIDDNANLRRELAAKTDAGRLLYEACEKCIEERDAALDREATLRRMLDLVMAIPEMTDEQLVELKRNCALALKS